MGYVATNVPKKKFRFVVLINVNCDFVKKILGSLFIAEGILYLARELDLISKAYSTFRPGQKDTGGIGC